MQFGTEDFSVKVRTWFGTLLSQLFPVLSSSRGYYVSSEAGQALLFCLILMILKRAMFSLTFCPCSLIQLERLLLQPHRFS